MTNVIRASVSPNIPRPIWYALCAIWSVSLKTGYWVINEHHRQDPYFQDEPHRELVLFNKCSLLLHRIGTDTDDQNVGTFVYFVF